MIKSLSPIEAKNFLKNNSSTLLLDVRESWEKEIVSLPDSFHISLKKLAKELNSLPKDKSIIVYCHHGSRSLLACAILIKNGFNDVYNLSGGIEAWSKLLDPNLPRY